MNIKQYLELMVEKNASDLFYRAGINVRMRIDGKVVSVGEEMITADEVNNAVKELTTNELRGFFEKNLDADFGIFIPGIEPPFSY